MYNSVLLPVGNQIEGGYDAKPSRLAETDTFHNISPHTFLLLLHECNEYREGSRTITIEQDEASPGDANEDQEHGDNFEAGVLRLRGGPTHGNRVTWQEGTVDNEFLNRKKSKSGFLIHLI